MAPRCGRPEPRRAEGRSPCGDRPSTTARAGAISPPRRPRAVTRSGRDDLDGDGRRNVRMDLHTDGVLAEALDRGLQLEPTAVQAWSTGGADGRRDVRRGHRAEEPATGAGAGRELDVQPGELGRDLAGLGQRAHLAYLAGAPDDGDLLLGTARGTDRGPTR